MMKRRLLKFLPWLITGLALFLAFRDIDLNSLWSTLLSANAFWLLAAAFMTSLSYLFRSRRWQFLFPNPVLSYLNSVRVLFLGFFMNNVLPARTGELVRAHIGSVVSGEKRTLVLATVASERLLDGLMLSLFFLMFSIHSGAGELSRNILYVAGLFLVVAIAVALTLWQRARIFSVLDRLQDKVDTKTTRYTYDRVQVFVNGLSPLCTWRILPVIFLSTLLVWIVELSVFVCIIHAYNTSLTLSHTVLFLVAVNFSSLIPAAPGGIGVIEAITKTVLVSVGVDGNIALSMVMSQHLIQYLIVGIPGILIMLFWDKSVSRVKNLDNEQAQNI